MNKIIFSLLTCFCLISMDAYAITLRDQSIVTDDVIRVQDLFHGQPRNGDKILGAAPRPGTQMTLSARTLQRVAIAMDLDWRPATSADHITVHRAATIISSNTVEKQMKDYLSSHVSAEEFSIQFTSGSPEMILPPNMAETFEVTDFSYNPETRWFEANLVAPSRKNVHTQRMVSGKIDPLAQIPTLKHTLRNGDTISRRDIKMISMPARNVNHDTFMRVDALIGKTPRRIITAGTPIKEMDVQEPRVVKRGETVTMIYNHKGLRLTSTGRAMENGARGDLIRVVNHQSSKTIDAVVSGAQEVIIESF